MHWGESLEYPTAEKKPWVQILHDNDNHWLMAASGYGEKDSILIYDSLRNAVEPCRHIIYSAALICPSKKDELQLEMMNTQIQSDGSSCGLFAIANATALAFGLNPSEYVYDATQLREHFIKCCSEKKRNHFHLLTCEGVETGGLAVAIATNCSVRVKCHSTIKTKGSPKSTENLLNAKDVRIGFM